MLLSMTGETQRDSAKENSTAAATRTVVVLAAVYLYVHCNTR